MSENTPPTFTSLAQRVAANNADIGFSGLVLAPIAEALAKIGITPTKPKVLAMLSLSSEAMAKGLGVNQAVGKVMTDPNLTQAEAANDKNSTPGAQSTKPLKIAA